MRGTIILVALVFSSYFTVAQTVTGSWYGRADVMKQGATNNYLTELILKQKGNEVEGIFGYYFKDSYQSFFIRGTYNKNTRAVRISNLPILFYKAPTRNGIECPMNFEGILLVSQARSLMRGTFYSDDKYKYTCPQISVNMMLDDSENNQDSILQNSFVGRKFWQPYEEDFVVNAAPDNNPATVLVDMTTVNTGKAVDTVQQVTDNSLMQRFAARKIIYNMDLDVESDSVRISFYDNGDIDGDSISVFLNRQPVLVNQELTARSLNVYVALDKSKDVNEIVMFAENLGKFPPNTALMVVTDGIHRYEVYLSSSLTQNAAVRLRRKK